MKSNKNYSSKALMITLGHNSSALFFNGVDAPIGYEEERFNKVKGSSMFPKQSIEEIKKYVGDKMYKSKVYVSHWFDTFEVEKFKEKYFDFEYFSNLVKEFDLEVCLLSDDFTHHDAHVYSSKAFFDYSSTTGFSNKYKHYIVADGFGNKQEVLSIYKEDHNHKPVLLHRVYGYKNSLGLMFQFATAYTGMTENQDEGKFNGYEVLIDEVTNIPQREILENKASVHKFVYRHKEFQLTRIKTKANVKEYEISENFINTNELEEAREYYYRKFDDVLESIKFTDADEKTKRIVIGYYVQLVVEKIMTSIVKIYEMREVCLSGGVFYNVKLNNIIAKNVSGVVSTMPLAGDQGAAIGMYYSNVPHSSYRFNFGDMCYGNREMVFENALTDTGIYMTNSRRLFVENVIKALNQNKIVNLFHGKMEFGPRALGNTSTVCIPSNDNAAYINKINGRGSLMQIGRAHV